MLTLGLAGAGVLSGGIQAISGASQARRAKKDLLNQINNQSVYQPSEYAQRSLAESQARENAKAAAVKYGESMAASGLANAQGLAQRNASSGSQALAMGASNIGQYNQALMDLGQVQNQFQQQGIQNTAAARNLMIGEGDKAFASKRQKEDMFSNLYAGQLAAGNAMLGQGLSSIAQSGISAASAAGNMDWSKSPKQVNLNSVSGKAMSDYSANALLNPHYGVDFVGPQRYKPQLGGTVNFTGFGD
jgi:hypothetical protein